MSPSLVQKLLLLIGLWGIVAFLFKHGLQWVVYLAVLFAALYALVLWMLRREDPRLAKAYGLPGCRQFIDLVCRISKRQPPIDPTRQRGSDAKSQSKEDRGATESSLANELLISDPEHFVGLEEHLNAHVVGHGDAVGQLIRHLHRGIALRQRSLDHAKLPPLGAFLFAGPPGIGKRHLATITARAIYKSRHALFLDLRDFGDDGACSELFGSESRGKPGVLLEEVKARPFQSIILDNVDRASPAVIERLGKILTEGSCRDTDQQRVSFKHCVFFLLTSLNCEDLDKLPAPDSDDGGRQALIECLSQGGQLHPHFLGTISDLILFRRLPLIDRAAVIGQLMEKECRKFNLALDYVEAEVLATEVAALGDADGFQLAPARVIRLLREPLARAAQLNRKGVLVRRAAPAPSKTPSRQQLQTA